MAGLVCGIIALVLSFFSAWTAANIIALALSIIGLILAAKAMKAAKLSNQPSGAAVAGLVLCIIALVISGIGFFACTLCKLCAGATVSSALNSL